MVMALPAAAIVGIEEGMPLPSGRGGGDDAEAASGGRSGTSGAFARAGNASSGSGTSQSEGTSAMIAEGVGNCAPDGAGRGGMPAGRSWAVRAVGTGGGAGRWLVLVEGPAGSGGGFGLSSVGDVCVGRGGGLEAPDLPDDGKAALADVDKGLGAVGVNIDRGCGRSLDFAGGTPGADLAFEMTGLGLTVGSPATVVVVGGVTAGAAEISPVLSCGDAFSVGSGPSSAIGALQLLQGMVPCLARRTRTTSSPTTNSVEHTLQRICMSLNHLELHGSGAPRLCRAAPSKGPIFSSP